MDGDRETKVAHEALTASGFFKSLLKGLVRDAFKLIIAFAVGTGAGAIVCWYYGIPLIFALVGGILVLALTLAFMTDSLFS